MDFKKIKEKNNLTQLRGTIGNRQSGKNEFYYELKDIIFKCGSKSLISSLFNYSVHASGIVLKKNALNLSYAKKYIGFLFVQQALVAQAMIGGNTLCTSRIFAYVGEKRYKSQQPLFKGRSYCNF